MMIKVNNRILKNKEDKPILYDVFYTENTSKKPILIFCHGYKGFKDWGAWNLMAEAFANAGFFFIKFNFSHNGTSIENPMEFEDLEAFGKNNYSKELDDLETVIDWCFQQEEYQKELDLNNITLLGHSRGGGIVCIKGEEDERVQNVISLAGVSDYKSRTATSGGLQEWKETGVKYVLNGRTGQQMLHFYQFYEDFIENEKRLTIKRAVENLNKPYCIIHGDADEAIHISEAENLKSWNSHAGLHIIKDANHVFGAKHPWTTNELPQHLEEAIAICKSFLGN